MFAPSESVLEHRGVEPLALALLAHGCDGGHHGEVGVDDARAVAARTRALGVRAEQRGLDAVGLRERLADRVEQPGVRRRVAPARATDRGLIDRHHSVSSRHRTVDQRALPRAGHPGHDDEHAKGDVDVDVLQVVIAGAAHLEHSRGRAHRRLQRRSVVEVAAGERAAVAQPVDRALEHDLSTASASAGAEVHRMVGDRDRLRLVLDDEHGVALVAQLQQEVVHALDVVRMQARGRLVEDVGDVGERRAEVADHLRALSLAARQRALTDARATGSRARCRRTSRGSVAARPAAARPTDRRPSEPTPPSR